MGAPGEYVLCGEGHVIGVIEDDLYWGDIEDKSSVYSCSENLKKSHCLECGRIAKYRIYHYGNINDCIDKKNHLIWNEEENRYIIPDTRKPTLNLNNKSLPGLTDDLVTLLIGRLNQSGLCIVHESQIGKIKLPLVSDEYLHNLMMNK